MGTNVKYKQNKRAKARWTISRNYKFNIFPQFIYRDLMWKDKFKTPRCERSPYITFEWLWFVFHIVWGSDKYWEQLIWINKYCKGDIKKAEESWGWTDNKNKSTWTNEWIK